VSTGDGIAIAWRAGAMVRDLEFFQFHPTALMKPGAPHFLISEAVRGEGAHLVDHEGRRFAFDYHPSGELAHRDVVSRAIYFHLQKTAENPANAHVYLDMRPIEPHKIRHRFPNIIQVCQQWGIDVFNELIPIAPAAHYWMGGIACDVMNRTSISGLYAIGETASTGVHGANRLASNSLLECLVFASQLAKIERDLYKEINGDLPRYWTVEEAREHFISFGQFERRVIPFKNYTKTPIQYARMGIATVFIQSDKDQNLCTGFLFKKSQNYIK
jgi:L-aspartate oxidase